MLERVIVRTAGDSEFGLSEHCRQEHHATEPRTCAAIVAGSEGTLFEDLREFERVFSSESDEPAAAIRAIRGYALGQVGRDAHHFTVNTDQMNFDGLTSVLVSRDLTKVVIVTYDVGA